MTTRSKNQVVLPDTMEFQRWGFSERREERRSGTEKKEEADTCWLVGPVVGGGRGESNHHL